MFVFVLVHIGPCNGFSALNFLQHNTTFAGQGSLVIVELTNPQLLSVSCACMTPLTQYVNTVLLLLLPVAPEDSSPLGQ